MLILTISPCNFPFSAMRDKMHHQFQFPGYTKYCIAWRDGAEKKKTEPKTGPKFDHPGKAFIPLGIECYMAGILAMKSSSKCISRFFIFFLFLRKYCQLNRPMSTGKKWWGMKHPHPRDPDPDHVIPRSRFIYSVLFEANIYDFHFFVVQWVFCTISNLVC